MSTETQDWEELDIEEDGDAMKVEVDMVEDLEEHEDPDELTGSLGCFCH
jgi:hypothetical protein